MEIIVKMMGGKKVEGHFDGHSVVTDQPLDSGGQGSAPSPFDLFLASLGTCAGFFIQSFCQKRDISTEGIEIIQKVNWNDQTHMVSDIVIDVKLPQSFPQKYREAVLASANQCTVKRHLATPPHLEVKLI